MSAMPPRRTQRVPENSVLFKWVIPALFVLFGLLLVVIVVFSALVLAGIVHFQ